MEGVKGSSQQQLITWAAALHSESPLQRLQFATAASLQLSNG